MQDDTIPDILCIGAAHWDVVGRAPYRMHLGSDVSGQIVRRPGGVALNIATALTRSGIRPALLTSMGSDAEGAELLRRCRNMGILTNHVHISEFLPTDRCLVVEDREQMIATLADTRSLETAGERILHPLLDGTLGDPEAPYSGVIILDGNLTEGVLAGFATDPALSAADLRIASASPVKARRLLSLLTVQDATFYLNLAEASTLCGQRFNSSERAASAVRALGAARVLITDGDRLATDSGPDGSVVAMPPRVRLTRASGAGDSFVAAHVAAETRGADQAVALNAALREAASYVSGETSL